MTWTWDWTFAMVVYCDLFMVWLLVSTLNMLQRFLSPGIGIFPITIRLPLLLIGELAPYCPVPKCLSPRDPLAIQWSPRENFESKAHHRARHWPSCIMSVRSPVMSDSFLRATSAYIQPNSTFIYTNPYSSVDGPVYDLWRLRAMRCWFCCHRSLVASVLILAISGYRYGV